jgi:mannose-6-phosphate isomerase-like protein (cupin superfamily)
MSNSPLVTKPGTGRTVGILGDVYRFLATGEETGGRYAIWECIIPPGGGTPPHSHSREEEGFYILEGEMTFHFADRAVVAGPGTFTNTPIGTLHFFKNESNRPVKMLISVAPAGLEQMFLETGTALPDGAQLAPAPTQAEIGKLLAAAPRYGVEIKGP